MEGYLVPPYFLYCSKNFPMASACRVMMVLILVSRVGVMNVWVYLRMLRSFCVSERVSLSTSPFFSAFKSQSIEFMYGIWPLKWVSSRYFLTWGRASSAASIFSPSGISSSTNVDKDVSASLFTLVMLKPILFIS